MRLHPSSITPDALRIVPLEQAETIPSAWYTDPALHAFDLETVIAPSWQYVGHMSQLAEPGCFVTATIAGNPVVVVRSEDGTLCGFYNVCRHRGGPLATAHQGCAQMLQCQYHGWTYRLDGSLRGVPRFGRTELFDKRDYGLLPISVATWEGLVFARLEDEGLALSTIVDGMAERIAPIRLELLHFARRVVYDVACNWKAYVDNYLEGYHLPLVHPELCDVLDVGRYVTETFEHYSLQHSPVRAEDNAYHVDDGQAYYYFVFPNTMLNILPGRLQMNRVEPVAADRCRVIFDYFYDTPTPGARLDDDLAFSDKVQQEDIEICEHVQHGLASRAYDQGRFSAECEAGVYHFHCLIKEAYR